VDERKKKQIETTLAWIGYSILFIVLIAFLLSQLLL